MDSSQFEVGIGCTVMASTFNRTVHSAFVLRDDDLSCVWYEQKKKRNENLAFGSKNQSNSSENADFTLKSAHKFNHVQPA